MKLPSSGPFLRQWSLLGLAAFACVLTTVLALALNGVSPASAQGDEKPARPTGLQVSTEQGSLDVAVGWDDVDGATSYLVRWREAGPGHPLNEGASVASSNAAITVARYGEWVVRIEACNDAGCGLGSAQRFRVQPPPNRAPVVNTDADRYDDFIGSHNAPRGTIVFKSFEGIFSDPDGDELIFTASLPDDRAGLMEELRVRESGSLLFFLYDADDDWPDIRPALPNPVVTEVTLTATDPDGLSASLTGLFYARWEQPPGRPGNLAVASSGAGANGTVTFTLTWDAPTEGGAATGYQILRRAKTEPRFEVLAADTGNADTTYSDATARVNTRYVYRVKAMNAAGMGPEAGPAEIFYDSRPGAPTGLSARPEANVDRAGFAATLRWAAPANGGTATGYQILRREANANSDLSVLVDNTGNADTTYRDATVAVGKSYIYRVQARNAAGLGELSQPAKVKIEDYHVTTGCGFDDCIQPIYSPIFLNAADVGNRIRADEYVIGVSINGESRAYPVGYLGGGKEVVKDTVGGTPIVVTFCPLCLTTLVYERTVDGQVYDIGASGKLMRRGAEKHTRDCLVLYDHQTRSLWSQVLGLGVTGEHSGDELKPVPHTLTTWGEWKKLHPDTKALEKPSATYGISFRVAEPGKDSGAAVLAARIGNQNIAYPFVRLPRVDNAGFNRVNVLLFYDSGSKTALIFNRTVDGRTLSFRHDSGSGAATVLVDYETGSKWKAFTGVATEGELQGKKLERIRSHPMYWDNWRNYYPDSEVYTKTVNPPGAPTGLSAGSDAKVDRAAFAATLNWDAPIGPNAPTSYQILRREARANSDLAVLVNDTGNTNTTYRDTAVTVGKKYIYRVKARNAAGLGPESQRAQVRIEDYYVSTGCGFDDCIRPIYNPSFLDAADVGNRIGADEYVIGVSINGESRAYSVAHLNRKEVVKDTVGGTPIVVTWCSNCMTTIVYERTVDGQVHNFGASGKLMRGGAEIFTGCLVLYDHETRSLWSQVTGASVKGKHSGDQLKPVPHTLTTWGEWKKLHPNTKALSKPAGGNITILVADPEDRSYSAVLAARIGDKHIAYPFSRLNGVDNTDFYGVKALLFYDAGSKTALIFDRRVDGRTISFRHDSGAGANTVLVDNETGSKWKAFTGVATEGELQGKKLQPIRSHPMFWRNWRNYYPGWPAYVAKPGAPAALSAELNNLANVDGGGFSVTLSWDAPANGGPAAGYQILRREVGSASNLSVLVDNTGNANTTYVDSTVAGDKTYIYRVKARNAAGLSDVSPPAQVEIVNWIAPYGTDYLSIIDLEIISADHEENVLTAHEPVIGVSINGESRAYSVPYMGTNIRREVINDTVGGTPIVVTYCPNCLTTIVYERSVGGAAHNFATSGNLVYRAPGPSHRACLVLYDRQTRSLWSQVLGVGISGQHNGVALKPVPHTFTTWGEWLKLHPDTKVMKKVGLDKRVSTLDIRVVEPPEEGRATMLTAWIGNKHIAYPFSRLDKVTNTDFNGVNLLLFYDAGSKTPLLFDRQVDDRTLTFSHDSGSGADTVLVDDQTGSKWQAFTGVATEGELQGKQLERIRSHPMYWDNWNNYYPGSRVYKK